MKRNLHGMSQVVFDVIIIGGGITGACIAWDAALRGLKVALFEKNDFSSGTSRAPSKLIHGGLRYLKNMEFGLVRESLQERRTMCHIAPHQVDPIPFVMPVYGWGIQGLPMLATGMGLYELLSYDKRWIEDDNKKIPSFKYLNKQETLKYLPHLPTEDLTGSMLFYDCMMHSPERLTLEFIISAAEKGAQIANYAHVTRFLQEGETLTGVEVKDSLTGDIFQINGKYLINATGPWSDFVQGYVQEKVPKRLTRSKGIHIIVRKFIEHGALISRDNVHLFLIPWRDHILIGTTDRIFEGHPDDFRVTQEDIQELLDKTNRFYPEAKLTTEDVLHFYGGLRPIVESDSNVYQASRKFEIYHHKNDGYEALISVLGGKYTTSRALAEQVIDLVVKGLKDKAAKSRTETVQICGGEIHQYQEYVKSLQQKYCLYPPDLIAHLIENYGTRAEKILALVKQNPQLMEKVHPDYADIKAQIVYAMEDEMALSLSDVLFQRTGLGTLGHPGQAALNIVADMMAEHLGWDDAKRAQEVDSLERYYTLLSEALA